MKYFLPGTEKIGEKPEQQEDCGEKRKKRIIGLVIFAVAVALIAGYIKFFNGTFLYIRQV